MAHVGPGPWSLSELRALGWSSGHIRAAVSAGRLVRPHRGALALPGLEALESGAAPLGRIRAAAHVVGPGAVVSHESAGVVQRTWLPWPVSRDVHLTEPGGVGRHHHGMRVHESRLPNEQVVVVDGLRVTTLARTALDLARSRSLPEAMVAVDGAARALALREPGASKKALRGPARAELSLRAVSQIADAFDSVRTWPGTVVVRAAIELADPASESPLESRSRGWLVEAKLPQPLVAFPVQGASGRWYFADFAWPERRLLGEADGSGKYGPAEGDIVSALRRERRRQRDLEDAGWTFVRWDSTETRTTVTTRVARHLVG